MYLVDTNVISAGAPGRAAAPGLATWMDEHSDELFISVVTVAEIQEGVAKARRERALRKAGNLASWLDAILHLYADRVLALDIGVAQAAGELSDQARAIGRPPGYADILIAATAMHHRLMLMTRNVKHFVPLGIAVHNPFDSLP